MKGWVYVISNRSMPGLVKIGYTMKDPEIRAAELNGTGVPTPYVVEYEVLVNEPMKIERAAHTHFSVDREGKEWFNLSPEDAVAGIKQVVNSGAFLENYKRVDRQKAEIATQKKVQDFKKRQQENERKRLEHSQREKEKNNQLELQRQREQSSRIQRQQRIDTLTNELKSAESAKYKELANELPEESFWGMFAVVAFCIAMGLALLLPDMGDSGLIWSGVILSFITTPFVLGYLRDQEKQAPGYKALEKKHNDKIAAIDLRLNAERRTN